MKWAALKGVIFLAIFALVASVAMVCNTWRAVEYSHDAVKNRELDVQLELARAMSKLSKPGFSIEPSEGKDKL